MDNKYFEIDSSKKVLQIGSATPDYTDLAKHIQRSGQIYQANDCKVKNVTINGRVSLFNSLKILKSVLFNLPNVVDYHLVLEKYKNAELLTLILLKTVFRFQLNVIFHDTNLTKLGLMQKSVLNLLLRFLPNTYFLADSALKLYKNRDINAIDARIDSIYIAAKNSHDLDIKKAVGLENFLNNHSTVITVCCPELLLNNKNDEYGIDSTIEAIRKLKQANKSVGALILVNKLSDTQYYNYLELLVQAYGLQESIYFLVGQHNLDELLFKTNIFVVANSNKNQQINILDALNYGIKTIVSDSKKIAGTISFKANDIEDLTNKILNEIKCDDVTLESNNKRSRPKKVIALDA